MNTLETSVTKSIETSLVDTHSIKQFAPMSKLARSQVFKFLQGIPHGHLVFEDCEGSYDFGATDNASTLKATVRIIDPSAYQDLAFGGSIGGAEAYMLGKWETPNLLDLTRLWSANIDFMNALDDSRRLWQRLADKALHWFNRNTTRQARKNISRHYDLNNEFFALFLDPEMMYSSAIFPKTDSSLDEAAVYKLEVICQKLELKPSDHLLEIGTGWGGLAVYAASRYGCKVTTTTISEAQFEAAQARVQAAGLEAKITVLMKDYRDLEGQFDKLVSVEMIEAVGHAYYRQYFSGCASLLKQNGLMLLQAITIPDQRYEYACTSVDFIQRYIFPGGSLPCHDAILSTVKRNTDLVMVGMQEIGLDYAKTLDSWRHRFLGKLDQVKALGFDDSFIRMWHYYLCYCQGGFEERIIGTSQILFAKPGWRDTRA